MAPLRSVEEIRIQMGLFESLMNRERSEFSSQFVPGITCMVCTKTYKESPELLITILKHTYCKSCITAKLQNDRANEFIIGVLTGWSVNPNMLNWRNGVSDKASSVQLENDNVLESSDGGQGRHLPRGYVYPNSKLMLKVQEGIGSKKRPYSSLRMNAEVKHNKPMQKGNRNKKMTHSSPGVIAKSSSRVAYYKKQKLEMSKRMGCENSFGEECLPEQGSGKLLCKISDDNQYSDSESVNQP